MFKITFVKTYPSDSLYVKRQRDPSQAFGVVPLILFFFYFPAQLFRLKSQTIKNFRIFSPENATH